MPKKTVAILHYSCPPVIGGVEFVIQAHAILFAEAGYGVKMIVGNGGTLHPGAKTVVIPEIDSSGGPIAETVKAVSGGTVPADFERQVTRVERKLATALKDVDVCMMHNVLTMHFNMVLTAALARLMAKRGRTRFIGWNHDSTFTDPHYAVHQRDVYPWSLLKQSLPGCRYCVISEQRQKEFAKLFGVPRSALPVISDGIRVHSLLGLTDMVERLYDDEKLYEKNIVALTPTRIVPRKNLERGIEIVAGLKRAGQSVRWIITGAPDPHNADAMEYFAKLTALRRKLRVQKEVIFMCERETGRVNDEDLRALFAASDMLLFPSAREGFGIPALEGGLAGLVLVLSDIPALKEIGGRSAVYIREQDNADDVAARAIRAVARSPRLVFKKKVIENYSWDAVFKKRIVPAVTRPGTLWKKS